MTWLSSLGRAALGSALLIGLGSTRAHAAPFTVTTLSDSGSGSLRNAIMLANRSPDADTIVFAPRVRGTLGIKSPLPSLSSPLSIIGPGRERLNVRRTTKARHSIFTITKEGTVLLSGLTVSNGFALPTDGNRPQYGCGGGIHNEGILQMNECAIIGNRSGGSGGGLFNGGLQLTLTRCLVTDNQCIVTDPNSYPPNGGGGLYNQREDALLSMTDCTFSRNVCRGSGDNKYVGGGAIENGSRATVYILRSILTQNTATAGGGALDSSESGGEYGGDFVVTQSLIANNRASSGAAISTAQYSGKAILTNCTLSGNKATDRGGAIEGGWAGVELKNCTIVNNIAPHSAGVWACAESSINQCIIAGNVLPSHAPGTDLDLWKPEKSMRPDPSQGYNLIGRSNAATLAYFHQSGDRNNVSVAGLKLGTLADNGGPTKTYALLPGSPAIGKGEFYSAQFDTYTDQRGVLRSLGRGGTGDIGAFQTIHTPTPKTKKSH